MKTYQEWTARNQHLDSFLVPGDEVDEAMADYFTEVLPPRTMNPALIQIGEPRDHFRGKDGKIHAIYGTLKKVENTWVYAGNCFAGESEPARHHIFVVKKRENPDFGLTFYRNQFNSSLGYVTNCRKEWYGADSMGQPEGLLKSGMVIHVMDGNGQQISEEITRKE